VSLALPAFEPARIESDSLVSIVMPAFNAGRFIGDSIRTVQAQTYTDWELLVVDDGSSDDTVDVVESFARWDRRVRLVGQGDRGGPGAARNIGIAAARGEHLAFLDSDDLWLPDRLSRQLDFVSRGDVAFAIGGYTFIYPDGRVANRTIRVPERLDYRALLKNTIIWTATVLLNRRLIGDIRMPRLPQHEDLVLWFDLLKRGFVAHGMQEPLAVYRMVHGSASRNKWRSAKRMWNVYRDIEHLSLPDTMWCYAHYAWRAWWKHRR
jgi:teichuronic acid biosynthesis glycosyltransferase TuaG